MKDESDGNCQEDAEQRQGHQDDAYGVINRQEFLNRGRAFHLVCIRPVVLGAFVALCRIW